MPILKCNVCKSPDIIMIEKPEYRNRPYFQCQSCGKGFTYGSDGGEFAEYVRWRQKRKKPHENFIYNTTSEYTRRDF